MYRLMILVVLLWSVAEAKKISRRPSPRSDKAMGPKSLPDGLMVKGGVELRSLAANWVVLVTLEKPKYPVEMTQHIRHIRTAMAPMYQKYSISSAVRDTWLDRLERLQDLDTPSTRQKRGLLNIGGSLLSTIFGVATEGQLEKYSKAVQTLKRQTDELIHVVPELMTVIN